MQKDARHGLPAVSIIIPTLNEEQSIGRTLEALKHAGGNTEVIVVDGGSNDSTAQIALSSGARVIRSSRGRGIQMHDGARIARGQTLLFLHADTTVPMNAVERITEVLSRDPGAVGGNFDVRFEGDSRAARLMTWLYPKLEKLGLYYGDSGIFVRASEYTEIGGFNPFPIFEDVDLVSRLKRRGRMVHLPVALVTSSRRFDKGNFALTFVRWTIMQGLYWIGVPPRVLNRFYAPVRGAKPKELKDFQSSDVGNRP